MSRNGRYSDRRLLVATPVDAVGSANTRTVHLVRNLAHHFNETFVISRPLATTRTRWSALLRSRTEMATEGAIRWVGLFPWGHVRDGLGVHLLGLKNAYAVPETKARRMLRTLLSSFGAVLEAGLLPSLLVAYWSRVGGRVDVFIGEGPWEILLGLILKSLERARVVVYDDIDYQPGFQPTSGLRRELVAALERFAVRRADLVICVGERLACLRRSQGARRVWVIPNGVDSSRFHAASWLRSTHLSARPTLIYTGYLGAWSGVDMLLEVAACALERVPELRLILLGHASPAEMETLRHAIRGRNLGRTVELRGLVPYGELPRHLAEAHIGVVLFPPLDVTRYAFPLKVVEYMAAGLPVVTTEGTEAADIVDRAEGGVVVSYDPRAAADALCGLLEDPPRRRRFGKNGLAFSRGFDWRRLMEREHGLIEAALRDIGSHGSGAEPARVGRGSA